MVKHERLYSALLVVLVLYSLAGVALLAGLEALPPGDRPPTRLPNWAFPFLTYLTGAYSAVAAVALYLRMADPAAGRRVTRGLNIALLFGPPVGTALGLYGLWKVDQGVPAVTG